MSLTKIVSDVAAEAAFQRGEVSNLDKVFGDEIPQKRFDHGRIAEEGPCRRHRAGIVHS